MVPILKPSHDAFWFGFLYAYKEIIFIYFTSLLEMIISTVLNIWKFITF